MLYRIFFLCTFLCMLGCRSAPFKVEKLAVKDPAQVEAADRKLSRDFEGVIDESLAERYKKKKSPSFALINGFYTLPEAKPYGAATVVKSYSYQTYFEAVSVSKGSADYALTPITGDDAISLEKALNALLNIGVKIKEISMTDALAIAKAEQDAAKADKIFLASKSFPPDVDYLISIYPTSSARGPVLVGRVIKRDGSLMAFRVIHRGGNTHLVGSLITSLFEDTISRI